MGAESPGAGPILNRLESLEAPARRGRAADGRAPYEARLRKVPPLRERWTTRVVR